MIKTLLLFHFKKMYANGKDRGVSMFRIQIDSSRCVSLIEGAATLDKMVFDYWKYEDLAFESGKIYGLISEYEQGCMYVSYLLGGRVDFDDLRIYYNDREVTNKDLSEMSWNLEPYHEKYNKCTVKKSIEKALQKGVCADSFAQIAEKFGLTEPRYDRKLFQLSGERWRASAALGYASGKQIFYAPYESSSFYYQVSGGGLLKALRNLTGAGALVLLPGSSDRVLKHIVDECVYLDENREYDIDYLHQYYLERGWGEGSWIK